MAHTLRNPETATVVKVIDGIAKRVPFTQTRKEVNELGVFAVTVGPWRNASNPPHVFGQSHKTRKH